MFDRQNAYEPESVKVKKFNETMAKLFEKIEDLEKEIARLKLGTDGGSTAKKSKKVDTEQKDAE